MSVPSHIKLFSRAILKSRLVERSLQLYKPSPSRSLSITHPGADVSSATGVAATWHTPFSEGTGCSDPSCCERGRHHRDTDIIEYNLALGDEILIRFEALCVHELKVYSI